MLPLMTFKLEERMKDKKQNDAVLLCMRLLLSRV